MTAHYDNRHSFEPIRQILDRLFASGPLGKKVAAAEIWTVWNEAVGASVAKHARPLALERGVLTILVDSPAWHHQLQFLEGRIKAELNARLRGQQVKKVRLRVAKV